MKNGRLGHGVDRAGRALGRVSQLAGHSPLNRMLNRPTAGVVSQAHTIRLRLQRLDHRRLGGEGRDQPLRGRRR